MSTGLSTRFPQALRPLFRRDPLDYLQQEIGNLFSRFSTDGNGEGPETFVSPAVDLSENDDSIQIRMDVPGIKGDEINVQVSGNMICISGEHKEEKEEKGTTFHRLERRVGAFSRTLPLPAAVKESQITAECKNGVLTIDLPKTEVAKKQTIKVIAK